jgi:predicted DCC family thiol-disulfide oxidoreductase YuxK
MPARVELLYDLDCGICQRAVEVVRRMDRHDRIAITAIQAPGAAARFGLRLDEALTQSWTLDESGRRAGGAQAFAVVADTAWGLHLFVPLLRIKPLARIADKAYRWVADHRYALPGASGACAVQPVGPKAA